MFSLVVYVFSSFKLSDRRTMSHPLDSTLPVILKTVLDLEFLAGGKGKILLKSKRASINRQLKSVHKYTFIHFG